MCTASKLLIAVILMLSPAGGNLPACALAPIRRLMTLIDLGA